MIEITYASLSSHMLTTSVQRLVNIPLPTQVAYQVKKIADAVMKARKEMAAEYQKTVVEPYAQKDEKGDFVHPDGDVTQFTFDEARKEEFEKANGEFGKKIAKIDRPKLHLQQLGNAQISAQDLAGLEPLLNDEEQAPNLTVVK